MKTLLLAAVAALAIGGSALRIIEQEAADLSKAACR
jgi:hypothetical protein